MPGGTPPTSKFSIAPMVRSIESSMASVMLTAVAYSRRAIASSNSTRDGRAAGGAGAAGGWAIGVIDPAMLSGGGAALSQALRQFVDGAVDERVRRHPPES